ncbi:8-oxo-dGTP diphosphatase [Paenarthrobacter sp. TE4293]|uniref:(deoxy)nucleoside triphosphate pyrophosphohydrolase n=1 Tax=Paenarthrobacter sp. TE4293 TaxID=3381695 RepID=UPI003D25DD90
MTALINVVGAAVVDSLEAPTRLLAARRSAPPQFAGMWEFPGGKVEAGETPESALHRELSEELGIEVRLGPELESGRPDGWVLNERAAMRVWFAEVTAGELAPLEDHDKLLWVSLDDCDEALNLQWIPADLPIVRALLDRVASPA